MAEDNPPALPGTGQSSAVDSGDPCTVFLCMAGRVYGKQPSECGSPVSQFFSINAFKKHHIFDPGKTARLRGDFLGQCPGADPAQVSDILGRFGRLRG